MSLKVYNTKGELQTDTQLSVVIEDIKDALFDLQEIQEKALFTLGLLEKHAKDASDIEPDHEDLEEDIKDLMVDVVD